jgi:hypothetical protein
MRKAGHILILFFIATASTSCKKETFDMDISGKVVDGATSQPLAGITIELSKDGMSNGPHTISDANGNYTFHVEATDGHGYTVKAEETLTHFYSINYAVPPEKSSHIDIATYPYAYLVFKVRMINTAHNYMQALFTSSCGRYGCFFMNFSQPADTVHSKCWTVKGGTTNDFQIQVKNSDTLLYGPYSVGISSSNYSYSIPCSATDTTYFSVQY